MGALIKTKPPKNRYFLGLVDDDNSFYWDIFFWATKEYGVEKGCYVDREMFYMPELVGWVELPNIDSCLEDVQYGQ